MTRLGIELGIILKNELIICRLQGFLEVENKSQQPIPQKRLARAQKG
jgi:hypothetical protein